MRSVLPTVLALIGTLGATHAAAQAIESPYDFIETRHAVTGYAGYFSIDPGSLDLAPHPAPIFGARYNIHLTGPLYGEAGLGFSPTQRTLYSSPGGTPPISIDALGDISSVVLLADAGLRFNFTGARTWRGLAPFATGTIGLVADVTGAADAEQAIDVEQRFEFGPGFAAGIGLGSEFFLSERLSLRAEARDYLWRLTSPGGLTEGGVRETEWRHNFSFTFGAAYHF